MTGGVSKLKNYFDMISPDRVVYGMCFQKKNKVTCVGARKNRCRGYSFIITITTSRRSNIEVSILEVESLERRDIEKGTIFWNASR